MNKKRIIFKSIINFFTKNIFSVIGIIMLVFFSSCIFITLNNATNNLNNSYQKIIKEGNIHDFVINERFILGTAKYNNVKKLNNDPGEYDPIKKEYSFELTPYNIETNKIEWTNSYKKIFNEYELWILNNKPQDEIFTRNRNLFEKTTYSFYSNDEPSVLTINNEIQKTIQENILKLESITSNYIPTIYISDIEREVPVNLRRFNSIEIPANRMTYKVIESSPNYSIDSIVLFDGKNLSENNKSLFNLFSTYADLSGNKLEGIDLSYKIIEILANTSWSSESSNPNLPNKILEEFVSFNKYIRNPPITQKDKNPWTMKLNLFSKEYNAQKNFKTIINKRYFSEKGFSITFDIKNLFPFTGKIEDKTSYEAIVTPEFLSSHNKEIFNYQDWSSHLDDSQDDFDKYFASIDEKYKIKVDNIDYVIIGSGISPDFMYPIISNEKMLPNLETEAIVYTNTSGYLKVQDSFRNSKVETMILGKFDNNITSKQEILDKINLLSKSLMDWPNNMNSAFFANDTSNIITPTTLRVIFIPNVMQIVSLVSYFLTSFIVIVSTIIIILFVKRFIELNKVNLAILQANGYKKNDIFLPLILSISILVLFSSILGFIFGFILQIPAMLIFESFWTLPTIVSEFNWYFLLFFVFILVIFYGFISLIISIFFLRGDNVNLMKNDAQFKGNFLINNSKKVFRNSNPLNKFRISLAYHSLSKLIVLSIMTSLVMTSLVFASSTYGSFRNSIQSSFDNSKKFKYDIQLFTPTRISGQYYGVPINNIGMTLIDGYYVNDSEITDKQMNDPSLKKLSMNDIDPINGAYKFLNNIKDPNNPSFKNPIIEILNKNGNWHLPSIIDIERQSTISFLKNLSQNKAILDISILGNNPWEISSRLMPINQKNYADDSFRELFSNITIDNTKYNNIVGINGSIGTYKEVTFSETLKSFSKETYESNINSFRDKKSNKYLEIDKSKIINSNPLTINSEFLTLLMNIFQKYNYSLENYTINFNKMPLYDSDETYTNVDFQIQKINNKPYDIDVIGNDYNLKGISSDTNFMKLTNKNGNNLFTALDEFIFDESNPTIPIILNNFASNELNVKVNDIIEIGVINHIDRYDTKQKNVEKLKVVGINDTYQSSEFYTLHKYANKLTKMDAFKINDLFPEPFNAIMSDDDSLVQINNTISSYSPSGIYIGSDRFSASAFLEILAKNKYEYLKEASIVSGIPLINNWESDKPRAAEIFRDTLKEKYGDSVYVSILDNMTSLSAMKTMANDIARTSNFIQSSILVVIILISSVIITLIIFMLILDSLKIAGMMKILGLRNFSNAISFMSIYFLAVFLGIIISIPLSIFVNFIYLNLIFNAANILLIAKITALDYLIASLSLIVFFIVIFSLNWIKIKRLDLTKIVK